MISVIILLGLLFLHWIGDFIAQSNWMAINKWEDDGALTLHVFIYSVILMVGVIIMTNSWYSMWCYLGFFSITFIAHLLTDGLTSLGTHHLSTIAKKTGNFRNFFILIGFDQLLHGIQLVLTYKLLFS